MKKTYFLMFYTDKFHKGKFIKILSKVKSISDGRRMAKGTRKPEKGYFWIGEYHDGLLHKSRKAIKE